MEGVLNMLIKILNNDRDIEKEIKLIGADPASLPFFQNKTQLYLFKVYGLKPGEANILKQELLSRGGDLIVHHQSVTGNIKATDAVIMGNLKTIKLLIEKLDCLPYWNLPKIKIQLEKQIKNFNKNNFKIKLNKKDTYLELGKKPLVMGIINVTKDSFYPSSRVMDKDLLLRRVEEFINNGVDILDLGGESTRPGAQKISLEEELERVVPAVEIIRSNFSIPISLDTYKAKVAQEGLEKGADIINDISGLQFDEDMVKIAQKYKAPVIINHIQGTPDTMQESPSYSDVITEITDFFAERIDFCLNNGLQLEQIILDPGIGFGKRLEDNLKIIKYLDEFKIFGLPLLIGASRKTLIKDVLKLDVDERLEGTLAITAVAMQKGAHIIRVHDVKENKRIIDMINAISEV